jgi:uncharacterized metal-binding protein
MLKERSYKDIKINVKQEIRLKKLHWIWVNLGELITHKLITNQLFILEEDKGKCLT